MSNTHIPLIFFGHHKCGSRFFRFSILQPVAAENGYRLASYKIQRPWFRFRSAHDLDLHNIDYPTVLNTDRVLLILANAGKPVRERIESVTRQYRGIRVIRDPRQVLVSNYFHHKEGHAIINPAGWVWDQLREDRPVLNSLPQEDGIVHELNSITGDILENQLYPWEPDPRILEFKLEEFSSDLDGNLRKICDHFGFARADSAQRHEVHANPASQKWRECFTPKITSVFKERYGQLLIDLGYERDFDW